MPALRALCLTSALLLLAAPCSTPAHASGLEGRWLLVHQSVGSGSADLSSKDAPLVLVFSRTGSRLSAYVHVAGMASAVPWPAFITNNGPAALTARDREIDEARGTARARYRAAPSAGRDSLEITEEYAIADGGAALVGSVTVSTIEDGQVAGSYTLHRRFERAP